MEPDDLRELRRFDPAVPIEEAWTPPSSWYIRPAFAARERETVFRGWLAVARAAQLAEPGSYASGAVAGQPWLIVRDEQGVLRGFHNVCRHHAAAVKEGAGRCEQLVCPYHGWTYRLDGSLKTAPRMAGVRAFDREHFNLRPAHVEVWGPLVFLALEEHAPPPIAPQLAELRRRLDHLRWEELRFVARKTYRLACNWKVYVDNYLDGGYHVPVLHGALSDQLDLASYRTEVFETYSIQSCRGGGDAAGDPVDFAARIGSEALYGWIYPNLMLNRYGPFLDTNHVWPLGPDACQVDMDYYATPEAAEDDAFVERALQASERVQDEDVMICESVQAGLRSPAYDVGRYAPQLEQGEHHFHRLLARDLAPD